MPAAKGQVEDLATSIPGLYASAPERLPFAPSQEIRTFLLRREPGNLLIYSTRGLGPAAAAIEEIGGISRHYLNHRHEAMFSSDWVDAPLFVHERERRSVERSYAVHETFSSRHSLYDDFEVIPAPGHTSGATAYLWDSGENRLLFTGDTIYINEGEWVAAVLESSDRALYIESLELIRELDFDLLVPWAATGGGPFYAHTDRDDARRRIDAILERVRSGQDH
jgi:glyoxylase-like metal-dependent hydrolase (beta-lactamase superfamily II)